MPSPPAEPPADNSSNGKSRLDRELEEILSRNDNIRHFPDPAKRPKKPSRPESSPIAGASVPPIIGKLMEAPVVVALALALVAYALSDISQLVASVLCFAAVACIALPIVRRFQRPSSPPATRMWRGQAHDVNTSENPTPVESLRAWWNSRNRS